MKTTCAIWAVCQLRYAIGAMRQLSKNISSSCRITHKTSSWPAQQSLSLQIKQLLSEEGDQASSSRARRRDASPSSFARCFMSSLGSTVLCSRRAIRRLTCLSVVSYYITHFCYWYSRSFLNSFSWKTIKQCLHLFLLRWYASPTNSQSEETISCSCSAPLVKHFVCEEGDQASPSRARAKEGLASPSSFSRVFRSRRAIRRLTCPYIVPYYTSVIDTLVDFLTHSPKRRLRKVSSLIFHRRYASPTNSQVKQL